MHSFGRSVRISTAEKFVMPQYQPLTEVYAGQDTFQRHSIHGLLPFIANLLRFDEAYHEVLRSVGLVSTLVALFLDQTNAICSGAASTQIRVEYPTNTVDARQAGVTPSHADDKLIISALASHCHQRARQRASCRTAVGRTDYVVLIDIMKLFAGGVRGENRSINEQYFERALGGLPMLEAVCTLTGNTDFQSEGLPLWAAIVRLVVEYDDEILRNAVNSLMQAVRYVTLAVYFPEDGEVTLAFPSDVGVLQGALASIESMLRPKLPPQATTTQYDGPSICLDGPITRDRVVVALVDCDVILSLLGILCAVAKKWESNAGGLGGDDVPAASCSAVMLALRCIFSLVTMNTEAERRFLRYETPPCFRDAAADCL
jgi:hypothetical protein